MIEPVPQKKRKSRAVKPKVAEEVAVKQETSGSPAGAERPVAGPSTGSGLANIKPDNQFGERQGIKPDIKPDIGPSNDSQLLALPPLGEFSKGNSDIKPDVKPEAKPDSKANKRAGKRKAVEPPEEVRPGRMRAKAPKATLDRGESS